MALHLPRREAVLGEAESEERAPAPARDPALEVVDDQASEPVVERHREHEQAARLEYAPDLAQAVLRTCLIVLDDAERQDGVGASAPQRRTPGVGAQ